MKNKEAGLGSLISPALGYIAKNVLPYIGIDMALNWGLNKLTGDKTPTQPAGGAPAGGTPAVQAPGRTVAPQAMGSALRPGARRLAGLATAAHPWDWWRQQGMLRTASVNEKAFAVGIDRFCKEAGFDEEDKAALYTLLEKSAVWYNPGTWASEASKPVWYNPFGWGNIGAWNRAQNIRAEDEGYMQDLSRGNFSGSKGEWLRNRQHGQNVAETARDFLAQGLRPEEASAKAKAALGAGDTMRPGVPGAGEGVLGTGEGEDESSSAAGGQAPMSMEAPRMVNVGGVTLMTSGRGWGGGAGGKTLQEMINAGVRPGGAISSGGETAPDFSAMSPAQTGAYWQKKQDELWPKIRQQYQAELAVGATAGNPKLTARTVLSRHNLTGLLSRLKNEMPELAQAYRGPSAPTPQATPQVAPPAPSSSSWSPSSWNSQTSSYTPNSPGGSQYQYPAPAASTLYPLYTRTPEQLAKPGGTPTASAAPPRPAKWTATGKMEGGPTMTRYGPGGPAAKTFTTPADWPKTSKLALIRKHFLHDRGA